MTTAAQVLSVARSQIGVHESPSGSNCQKFGYWYGLNGEPWCAMFVSWVFHQAGYPLSITTSRGYSYCPSGVDWFKQHGLWHTAAPFEPGDIIFYDWAGNGVADHTGIVVKDHGSMITTIEGNTSLSNQQNGGAVMERQRPHGYTVLGVGRVKFASAVPFVSRYGDHFHHPVLKKGMTDESDGFVTREVTHLQHLLYRHGRNIPVDGSFGAITLKAVKGFQGYHRLRVDGQVGPITWNWLHK